MKKRLLKRPSPALMVSILAVVLAASGVAGALPGKKSVDKNDLKRSVVKTGTIRNSAVTSPKIANGAVTPAKLASDTRGQAVAWAEVNSNGTIAAARGISASNISKPGGATAAFFCLNGLPEFGTAVVSPVWAGDAHEFGFPGAALDLAPFAPGSGSCPGGGQIIVATWFSGIGTTSSSYSAQAFTIALFK